MDQREKAIIIIVALLSAPFFYFTTTLVHELGHFIAGRLFGWDCSISFTFNEGMIGYTKCYMKASKEYEKAIFFLAGILAEIFFGCTLLLTKETLPFAAFYWMLLSHSFFSLSYREDFLQLGLPVVNTLPVRITVSMLFLTVSAVALLDFLKND